MTDGNPQPLRPTTYTREQILAMSDEEYAKARKALSEHSRRVSERVLAQCQAARLAQRYGGSR